MKHIPHLLITAHIFIATHSCIAMEKQPKILMELKTLPDEQYTAFITNDKMIINGDQCRILDLTTKTPDITIKAIYSPNNIIELHPNKKLFALSNQKKITIYDTETTTEIWSHPRTMYDKPTCMFNPSDTTIFTWHEVGLTSALKEYNYCTNQEKSTNITNIYKTGFPATTIHPKEHQLCVEDDKIYIYNYDENDGWKKINKFNNYETLSLIKYSACGSLIACASQQTIDIINLNNKTKSNVYKTKTNNDVIISTEFHPNSSILAILTAESTIDQPKTPKDFNVILRYLDINNKNTLAEISLSDLYPSSIIETKRSISLSPDGTKIMIKFNDRSVILALPF